MSANLDTIRNVLDRRPDISSDLKLAGGRLLAAAVRLARRWAAPAVTTPRWWAAVKTKKIDLNDPAFHQNSDLLHEFTRRM